MKIQKLIEVFKKLLPIYEKGYKERWYYHNLYSNSLEHGLCYAAICHIGISISWTFIFGYYKNLINENNYLFPKPNTGRDLKPRIDFMKAEIKSLNKLLKEGYTHV